MICEDGQGANEINLQPVNFPSQLRNDLNRLPPALPETLTFS